jgi:hypothetical protein
MGRGVLLLGLAVIIGVVLLNATQAAPPGANLTSKRSSSHGSVTTTTAVTTTTLALRAPKDVKVVVANASGIKGAAGKVSDLLKPPGYNVLSPTNASPNSKESSVYFAATFEREAAGVAQLLQLPSTTLKAMPTPAPIADLRGAQVLVIVGTDMANRVVGPVATTTTTRAGATTTTTARATTTTTAAATTTTKKP